MSPESLAEDGRPSDMRSRGLLRMISWSLGFLLSSFADFVYFLSISFTFRRLLAFRLSLFSVYFSYSSAIRFIFRRVSLRSIAFPMFSCLQCLSYCLFTRKCIKALGENIIRRFVYICYKVSTRSLLRQFSSCIIFIIIVTIIIPHPSPYSSRRVVCRQHSRLKGLTCQQV